VVSRTAVSVAILFAVYSTATAIVTAQSLQRLAVQSFDLGVDSTAPRVDVPFRLILTLRVRQRVAEIENLNLPILAQLELLGDERETTSTARGTQYRETITVVAHDPGTITIGSATLQAIDARDGKPKQWFSNGLTLRVGGGPRRALGNAASTNLVLWIVGIAGIVAIAVLLFRHPRRVVPMPITSPSPEPPSLAAPVPRTRRQQAHDALVVLQAERTRRAAIAVRSAMWRMVGAPEGETLGDVLRRIDPRDVPMRDLLVALERSAFTYDADLTAAIDDSCSALSRYVSC